MAAQGYGSVPVLAPNVDLATQVVLKEKDLLFHDVVDNIFGWLDQQIILLGQDHWITEAVAIILLLLGVCEHLGRL